MSCRRRSTSFARAPSRWESRCASFRSRSWVKPTHSPPWFSTRASMARSATSPICTAQVLLAVMASMYAVYHGPEGLARIARRSHRLAAILKRGLAKLGFVSSTRDYFDTITVDAGDQLKAIVARSAKAGVNFRLVDEKRLGISIDETTTRHHVEEIWRAFSGSAAPFQVRELERE